FAGLPFADKSFDVVCASFVVHGFHKKFRKKMYAESSRIAKSKVIYHDYGKGLPSIPVLLIELLEMIVGGDYLNFRKNGLKEMKENFKTVIEKKINPSLSWYICEI
ncbi:MAG TPA: class I SAM-dependent methyltransferase, partial [Spirochaeta sp.]|nr:class I SAM-dependent methyltransferase [Spirochaeta sp.]